MFGKGGGSTFDIADTGLLRGTTTAEHIRRGDAGDGVVVLDGTGAGRDLVRRANPQLLPCGVGRYRGRSGEESESSLHGE